MIESREKIGLNRSTDNDKKILEEFFDSQIYLMKKKLN